ncbi:MAG: hypothetical protein MMC23_001952 [Stictis urceolatum]|nr:hypothetical protein [Stictis urceolata]
MSTNSNLPPHDLPAGLLSAHSYGLRWTEFLLVIIAIIVEGAQLPRVTSLEDPQMERATGNLYAKDIMSAGTRKAHKFALFVNGFLCVFIAFGIQFCNSPTAIEGIVVWFLTCYTLMNQCLRYEALCSNTNNADEKPESSAVDLETSTIQGLINTLQGVERSSRTREGPKHDEETHVEWLQKQTSKLEHVIRHLEDKRARMEIEADIAKCKKNTTANANQEENSEFEASMWSDF